MTLLTRILHEKRTPITVVAIILAIDVVLVFAVYSWSTRASLADASATIEDPALTTLSWDSQDQIKGAMHSLSFNPSRVLFPSPGAYLISVRIRWSSGMTNGFFYAVLNGDADLSNALYKIGFDRPSQGGGGSQGVRMFFWYDFAKDDYLQIKIVGTGTAGTVTANLNVCRICPT